VFNERRTLEIIRDITINSLINVEKISMPKSYTLVYNIIISQNSLISTLITYDSCPFIKTRRCRRKLLYTAQMILISYETIL